MSRSLLPARVLPWIAWFLVSLGGLYQFLLQTSTSVMIPSLEAKFHIDAFGVSLLSSSFFYTYLICQMPAGIVIDRIKPRRTMSVCLMVMAIACVLFSLANSVYSASLSRMIMGFFGAPSFIAAFYMAARTLPSRYFPVVAGLTETLGMLGGVAGEALIARSVLYFDWRHTLWFLGAAGLFLGCLIAIFVRDEPCSIKPLPQAPTPAQSILDDLWCIIRLPQAWINGIFCGLLFGIISGFAAFWCVPFLMARYQLPLSQAADMSSVMFIGTAVGTPVVGALSSRWRNRRGLMLIGASIACLLSIWLIYFSPTATWQTLILLGLLGFFSGVYLLPFAVIREITPENRRGTAMGYINMMCILIGAPLLQPLIGWILHLHSTITINAYHQALMVIPLSLVIAIGLACYVKQTEVTDAI